MAAPCAAVPLPGGRPLPSGPILMSQSASSASLIGLPRPGLSAAIAVFAANATATTNARLLPVDMLRLPLVVDGPGCNDVHVSHREGGHRDIDLGLATFGEQLGAGRLHIAGLVPSAALQHDRLAVPTPRHTKPGERLAEHRRVECSLRPALA